MVYKYFFYPLYVYETVQLEEYFRLSTLPRVLERNREAYFPVTQTSIRTYYVRSVLYLSNYSL
jgi:hypothetical protein